MIDKIKDWFYPEEVRGVSWGRKTLYYLGFWLPINVFLGCFILVASLMTIFIVAVVGFELWNGITETPSEFWDGIKTFLTFILSFFFVILIISGSWYWSVGRDEDE